ncbi:MAG: arylsulfatase, partial [Ilumatobacteraceae bacterium]
HDITTIAAPAALSSGSHTLVVEFAYDGGFGAGGELVLSVDGEALAGARLERTVPIVFSMSGETFDVGCDTGAPVGPYGHGGVCSADITGVTLTRLDEPSAEVRRLVAEGLVRAGFSTQ